MARLKIVALIGTPIHLNFFVNKIAEHHEIKLVIRENSRANIIQKIFDKGLLKSLGVFWNNLKNRKKITKDYNDILGSKWQSINPSIPLITVADINSPEVKELLESQQPDVVIVQGTTLIKNKTLMSCPLVLNLHWGLSPYYKGSMCTEWAILNNDVNNIGFTIHKISTKIDGGDIVTQGRPEIESHDTAHRINMKLNQIGAEAMCGVLDVLEMGGHIAFRRQDDDQGRLFLMKDWTSEKAIQLAVAENNMSEVIKNSDPQKRTIVNI